MFRFQHNDHLLLLAIVPVVVALFIWMISWRRKKLNRLGDQRLIRQQLLGTVYGRGTLKLILFALALALAIIGWANLQKGSKAEQVQRKGVDVVIALDVSKSMLAQDLQPDRLTRAKQLISRMMDKMKSDRVALIVFAGHAYLQVPLTVDYSAMKMMLQTVNPGLIPTQGTVISEAVDLANKSFSQKEKKYKAMVLISDGEDHDDKAISKVREAVEQGVIVHTVGIGSPQGATLLDPETKSIKLDEAGNPVVSKLNEAELQSIAKEGKGTYTLLRNTDDAADKLVDEIDGMEQKSMGAVVFTDYTSYFQYFLLAAVLLLLLEWLLPNAKMKTA